MHHVLRAGMAMLICLILAYTDVSAQAPNVPPPVMVLYSTGNGQWNTPNFWTDNQGNFYTDPDDATVDVVIQSGHSVTLTVGGRSCHNLMVAAGAMLQASGVANRYLNIFGHTLNLSGDVGGSTNGLSFNIESPHCTISANGNADISRLRKSSSGTDSQLFINGNLKLHFNGTALTNQAIGTRFDIQVDGVLTVDPGHVSLDGVDGTNSVNQHGSVSVNGALHIVQGNLYAVTDNSTGYDITYRVNSGAELLVGGQIIGNSGVGGSAFAEIINHGSIVLQGSGLVFSQLDLARNIFSFNSTSLSQYNGAGAIIESTLPYGQLVLAGGSAILNGPTSVSRQLLLQNTVLQLGDFTLTMAPGSHIQQGTHSTSFIQTNGLGYLRQWVGAGTVVFPVGNSSFNPVHLRTDGAQAMYQVRVLDEVRSEGLSGDLVQQSVVNRTWLIEAQQQSGLLEVDFFWLPSQENFDFDRQHCYISRYQHPSWIADAAASALPSMQYTNYYQRQINTHDQAFTYAVASSGILPAIWGDLRAVRQGSAVWLEWSTLQEVNTESFTVEWSSDGRVFRDIASVAALGYSTSARMYHITHPEAGPNQHFYRIRLQDVDGRHSWSSIVHIPADYPVIRAYPNPAQNLLYLSVPSDISSYQIYESMGTLVQEGRFALSRNTTISISSLPAGLYYLVLDNGTICSFVKI